jgi:hypothetical protein
MAHLMGDNVGLRELRFGAPELLFQLIEERGIEVDGSVRRAIKWANRRRRHAASGLHPIGEKHHVRGLIAFADLAELFLPDLLGETQDRGIELAATLLLGGRRALFNLAIGPSLVAARCVADELFELLRIDAEEVADE